MSSVLQSEHFMKGINEQGKSRSIYQRCDLPTIIALTTGQHFISRREKPI